MIQNRLTFCNFTNRSSHRNDGFWFLEMFTFLYQHVQWVIKFVIVFSCVLISEQSTSSYRIFVLHFVRWFHQKYGHSKGDNNEFIMSVLHMYRKFHHKYVHSKVWKSMFYFIRQSSYVSTIHFLFNQSYFHYLLF